MKKKEIVVGNIYLAKVSKVLVPVKILRESPLGGWIGENLKTGRQIRIKSPRRLRRPF